MEGSQAERTTTEPMSELGVWVEQTTRGLVRDVSLETVDGRVTVSAFTDSYHVREVAILALAVLVEALPAKNIELQLARAEMTRPAEDAQSFQEEQNEPLSP